MDFNSSVNQFVRALSKGSQCKNSDNLQSSLQNLQSQHGLNQTKVIQLSVDACFDMPKLLIESRKLVKNALNSYHKHFPAITSLALSEYLGKITWEDNFNYELFLVISFFLDDCPFSCDVISKFFGRLMKNVGATFERVLSSKSKCESKEKEILCSTAKLALRMLQHLKEDVRKCIVAMGESYRNLTVVGISALTVLQRNGNFESSLCNMCGIIIGQLVNYIEDDENAARFVFYLCGEFDGTENAEVTTFKEILFESNFHFSKQEEGSRYQILLTIGLFSCTRKSVFLSRVNDSNSLPTFLRYSFRIQVDSLRFLGECQFHSFQAMKLWWIAVISLCKSEAKSSVYTHFDDLEHFIQCGLQIVYEHWDNPISGVTDMVQNIAAMTIDLKIDILNRDECRGKGDADEFIETMIDDLIALSPYVKGKYGLITLLFIKARKSYLQRIASQFSCSLVSLLSVNHLCPVVSKPYRTLITSLTKNNSDKQMDDTWKEMLAPGLILALLNENNVIRTNALRHWLPVHLKSFPNAHAKLNSLIHEMYKTPGNGSPIMENESALFALIGISKIARLEKVISFEDVDVEMLRCSLSNFNSDIRAEAFSLLCSVARTTDEISELENTLVLHHLPLNMNSDSPAFRQHFVICFQNFLQRVIDSCAACLKRENKSDSDKNEYAVTCCQVIATIFGLCSSSLHVSLTYQRKKTALDMFCALLKIVTSKDNVNACAVIKFLQTQSTNFDLDMYKTILIEMMLDTIPEIREQAFDIIIRYCHDQDTDECKNTLLQSCNKLCRSPRAQDAECGALLCQYLFLAGNNTGDVTATSFMLLDENAIKFLHSIMKNLCQDIQCMKNDILRASRYNPVHGWLLALDRCLKSLSKQSIIKANQKTTHNFLEILICLKRNNLDVINFYLTNVFGCGFGNADIALNNSASDNKCVGVSADFNEVTQKIKQLTLQSSASTDADGTVLLTYDHESILACSWLCLLHGSSLLSTISSVVVNFFSDNAPMHTSILTEVCHCLVSILTSCRHRGAIEGCYDAFLSTCRNLISSGDEDTRSIPKEILLQILLEIRQPSLSNTTRRSAGIPLVIEAILVASVSCSNDALFHEAISLILSLSISACSLTSEMHQENLDIPAVHCIYILKHLFRNSTLGPLCLKYSIEAFHLSLKCLSSPLWIVRNAATYLFGAVSKRMLGQKHIDNSNIVSLENSITANEFFSHFPEIADILLEEMENYVNFYNKTNTTGNGSIPWPQAGLHPALSVLSKLTHGPNISVSLMDKLLQTLADLFHCPVYSIRRLAAQSLAALESHDMSLQRALKYAKELPLTNFSTGTKNLNYLHGQLLFLKIVLPEDVRISDNAILSYIFDELMERSYMGCIHKYPYPFIASAYLDIINSCRDHVRQTLAHNVLKDELLKILNSEPNRAHMWTKLPCFSSYLQNLTHLVLLSSKEDDIVSLSKTCINSAFPESQLAVMDWMLNSVQQPSTLSATMALITGSLIHLYENKLDKATILHSDLLCKCFEFLIQHSSCLSKSRIFRKQLSLLEEFICKDLSLDHTPLSLQCSSLIMLSAIIVNQIDCDTCIADQKHDTLCKLLSVWTSQITKRTSTNKASEPVRKSAGDSLKVSGKQIILYLLNQSKHDTLENEALEFLGNIVCAVLSLLHDEQMEIRRRVCEFVSVLCFADPKFREKQCCVLHQNIATREFLGYVFKHVGYCQQLLGKVLNHCFSLDENLPRQKQTSGDKIILFEQEPFNLYEEPVEIAKYATECILDVLRNSILSNDQIKWWISKCKEVLQKLALLSEDSKSDYILTVRYLLFLKIVLKLLKQHGDEHAMTKEILCQLQKMDTNRASSLTMIRELIALNAALNRIYVRNWFNQLYKK